MHIADTTIAWKRGRVQDSFLLAPKQKTAMDNALRSTLLKEGVSEATVDILEDEELGQADLLEDISDQLLKTLAIKGGQIVKIRKAVTAFLGDQPQGSCDQQSLQSSSGVSPLSATSVPPLPSMPGTSSTTSFSDTPAKSGSATSAVQLSSTSFAIRETKKHNNVNWIKDFKLPETFSPVVTKGLKEGNLSGNAWNEFNRTICNAIMVYTLYPTMDEKEKVASMVLNKYPFLKDTLGGGLNSWKKAMSLYFKNKRRKTKHGSQAGPSKLKRPAPECDKPKFKKRCLNDDLSSLIMGDGETKETCEEHINAMKKEMQKKKNRDKAWISELMKLTYPMRRENMLQEPENSTVESTLSTYPALQLVSELKAEFGRVLSEPNAPKDAAANYTEFKGKILEIAKQYNCKKLAHLVKNAESIVDDNPEKKSDIECCLSAMALQYMLKDKAAKDELFFKICSEDDPVDEAVKKSIYPRLVASGQLGDFAQFIIAADCKILAKLQNMDVPMAIALLIGVFYIFNIEYTPGVRGVFAFLEAVMFNRHHLAKNRIAVQKLIKQVGACQ